MGSQPRFLIGVFLVALLLRTLFVFTFPSPLVSDAHAYHQLATNLASGAGYRGGSGALTSYRPPGYAFFLASLYRLFGSHTLVPRVFQALIGAITVLLAALIARALYDEKTSLIVGVMLSISPLQIYYTNLLLGEVLFTGLFALYVFLLTRGQSSRRAFVLGIVHGVNVLIRPSILFHPLIFLQGAFPMRVRLRHLAILFAISTLVIAGWMGRNFRVFGGNIMISTNAGVNFWIGHNPAANGTYRFPPDNPLSEIEDESIRSETGLKLGMQYLLSHPIREIELAVHKIWWLVMPDFQTGAGVVRVSSPMLLWLYLINVIWFAPVVFFSLLHLSELPHGRWLFLTLAYWAMVHIVFFGHPRFLYPVLPFLLFPLCHRIAHGFRLREVLRKRNGFSLFLVAFTMAGWLFLGARLVLSVWLQLH